MTTTTARDARSAALLAAARRVIPGGVNSPVRAFRAVGGTPRFIARGEGPYIYDADGHRYIDYVLSWGPLILGHAHPAVVAALRMQAERGTSFGAPTEAETELAELIVAALPSIEMVRFVSSGTEATMSALRLARAATGRNKIVKFDGCYHGHADALLVQAGSGVATLGLPDSPGVTPARPPTRSPRRSTTSPPSRRCSPPTPRDRGGHRRAGRRQHGAGAAAPGYLQGLRAPDHAARRAADLRRGDDRLPRRPRRRAGAVRRHARPHLPRQGDRRRPAGRGLRRAARAHGAGRPAGPMYQAGTLSGNPLAMAAGIATLRELARAGTYEALSATANALVAAVNETATRVGVPVQAVSLGSMWGFFFSDGGP